MTSSPLQLAQTLGHGAADKRIEILRRIGTDGSISEAARGVGVSYKAAWQALETLSNLAGTALVEKVVGGKGGGGAVLTLAGRRVLDAATKLNQARADVLALLDSETEGETGGARTNTAQGAPSLAAMGLRTSMRNQFPCRVDTLEDLQGLVKVGLKLPNNSVFFSRVTRESVELLGLHAGLPVLALCKATAVHMAASIDTTAAITTYANVFVGTVSRASDNAQDNEVALQLDTNINLVGFCDSSAKLQVGQTAMASIEASGIVIALTTS